MLIDPKADRRLTDNLNMNRRQQVSCFQPQNVHVDPHLGASLKQFLSLPDLDQPATFLLHQCCNPLLVSLACERPALSPARLPLYEDVQQIRTHQLCTVERVRTSDTSRTARNLAFDARIIQIRPAGSGDPPPTRIGP